MNQIEVATKWKPANNLELWQVLFPSVKTRPNFDALYHGKGFQPPLGLRVNSPWGEAEWAIDPWPLRAKGLIVLVSPN